MNLCQIFLTLLLVIPALTVGNLRLKPVDPIKTIAIIGTNDIHGTAFPQELLRTDTN